MAGAHQPLMTSHIVVGVLTDHFLHGTGSYPWAFVPVAGKVGEDTDLGEEGVPRGAAYSVKIIL